MDSRTRCRISSDTWPVPLKTRDTVATDTPARRAISRTVIRLELLKEFLFRNVRLTETGYRHHKQAQRSPQQMRLLCLYDIWKAPDVPGCSCPPPDPDRRNAPPPPRR